MWNIAEFASVRKLKRLAVEKVIQSFGAITPGEIHTNKKFTNYVPPAIPECILRNGPCHCEQTDRGGLESAPYLVAKNAKGQSPIPREIADGSKYRRRLKPSRIRQSPQEWMIRTNSVRKTRWTRQRPVQVVGRGRAPFCRLSTRKSEPKGTQTEK